MLTRERLLFIARCVDTAMFVTGMLWPVFLGWPRGIWAWFGWAGLVLPLVTSLVWVEYKAVRLRRAVRKSRAYRRAKFGGFTSVPGGREVIPVDRPTPWTDR